MLSFKGDCAVKSILVTMIKWRKLWTMNLQNVLPCCVKGVV